MLAIVFLAGHIFFLILIFYLVLTFLTGAPFVPSTTRSSKAMVELAHLKAGMTIYDLGSGDGRILREAAKRGVKAVGIEINPFLVLWSRLQGLSVKWQSLWKADIRHADVVFIYLLPMHMKKLEAKLKGELHPGALIVSNSFVFPGWKIVRRDIQNHIYVFQI